jgi:hypothetical protein
MTHATLKERLNAIAAAGLDAKQGYRDIIDEAAALIKREGLFEEFFTEFGDRALYALFMDLDKRHRTVEWTQPGKDKTARASRTPGPALTAFLALPFTVDGHRTKLGDMTRAECEWSEHHYTEIAGSNAARADFLARRLVERRNQVRRPAVVLVVQPPALDGCNSVDAHEPILLDGDVAARGQRDVGQERVGVGISSLAINHALAVRRHAPSRPRGANGRTRLVCTWILAVRPPRGGGQIAYGFHVNDGPPPSCRSGDGRRPLDSTRCRAISRRR